MKISRARLLPQFSCDRCGREAKWDVWLKAEDGAEGYRRTLCPSCFELLKRTVEWEPSELSPSSVGR